MTLICAHCEKPIDANKSYSGRPGNACCSSNSCTKAYLESSRDPIDHFEVVVQARRAEAMAVVTDFYSQWFATKKRLTA